MKMLSNLIKYGIIPSSQSVAAGVPSGQEFYTTAGTFSWTAPAGVTSVCAAVIGGGGSGNFSSSTSNAQYSGGGGGRGYRNSITVVPGQSYTVIVANGGPVDPSTASNTEGIFGGASIFIDSSTVRGLGGANASATAIGVGGGFTGDGGNTGGNGNSTPIFGAGFAQGGFGHYMYGQGFSIEYGRGGAGATAQSSTAGSPGAVYLIWGEGRSFPSTNVDPV
jgi:hypothetical protein